MKQNPNGIYSSDQKTDLELLGFITNMVNFDLRKFEEEIKLCHDCTEYNKAANHLHNAKSHLDIIFSRAVLYKKIAPHIGYMIEALFMVYRGAENKTRGLRFDELESELSDD